MCNAQSIFNTSFLNAKLKIFTLTMYNKIKESMEKNPALKSLLQRTHLTVDSLLGIVTVLVALILDSTFIGSTLNNLVCLFFPLQETLCLLKSPNPNVRDMKKCLLILTSFAAIIIVEPLLKRRVPLFAGLKMVLLISIAFKQSMQDMIQNSVIDALPIGNQGKIEKATAKAAEKVKETLKEETDKTK